MEQETPTGISIDTERVTAVLVGTKWFNVDARTLAIGRFSFGAPSDGGSVTEPITGFRFRASGEWIAGPLSSLLAVQYSADT
jgi:hypothetical protein